MVKMNEIADHFKNVIKTGEMKPLSLLETADKEKYDLVVSYVPENEKVRHYYYEVSICIILDENRQHFFTPEKYHAVKELPEYKNLQIERIEYAVWYYEAFHNKYKGWAGDPTGKCFSLLFNDKNEFMGKFLWK
jgi:hypothetical protein